MTSERSGPNPLISLRVPQAQHDILVGLGRVSDKSIGAVVRLAIDQFIESDDGATALLAETAIEIERLQEKIDQLPALQKLIDFAVADYRGTAVA